MPSFVRLRRGAVAASAANVRPESARAAAAAVEVRNVRRSSGFTVG